MLNPVELAAIVDQLGGIDEAAEALEVDPILIEAAFAGFSTRKQDLDIEQGILSLKRDDDLAADYGVDFTAVDERIKALEWMHDALIDDALFASFIQSFANGKLSYDLVESGGYDFFFDTTLVQARAILNYIAENEGSGDGFSKAYTDAVAAKGSIYSKDADGSIWFEYLKELGLDDSEAV